MFQVDVVNIHVVNKVDVVSIHAVLSWNCQHTWSYMNTEMRKWSNRTLTVSSKRCCHHYFTIPMFTDKVNVGHTQVDIELLQGTDRSKNIVGYSQVDFMSIIAT